MDIYVQDTEINVQQTGNAGKWSFGHFNWGIDAQGLADRTSAHEWARTSDKSQTGKSHSNHRTVCQNEIMGWYLSTLLKNAKYSSFFHVRYHFALVAHFWRSLAARVCQSVVQIITLLYIWIGFLPNSNETKGLSINPFVIKHKIAP